MLGLPIDYGDPINRRHPLGPGMLSWWHALPHRKGGTTLPDLLGTYPLTLNGITGSPDTNGWTPGRYDRVFDLGGGWETARNTSVVTVTGDFSWFAAVYPRSAGTSVVWRHSASWRIQTSAGSLGFTIPGVADYTFSTLTMTAGVHQLIGVTLTGTTVTGWLNGKNEVISSITAPSGSPTDFVIGDADFGLSPDWSFESVWLWKGRCLTAADVGLLNAEWVNRYSTLFRRFSRRSVLAGGGGSAASGGALTATPDFATVTVSGVAPASSGTGTGTVTPGVGTVTISGVVPAASGISTATAVPDVAAITTTGVNPAASGTGTSTTTPGVGTVTIIGIDSVASGGGTQSATPGVGTVTLTGVAPAASATGSVTSTPAAATITTTGVDLSATPTGSAPATASIATITLIGVSPSATGSGIGTVVAGFATITITGTAPTAGGPAVTFGVGGCVAATYVYVPGSASTVIFVPGAGSTGVFE